MSEQSRPIELTTDEIALELGRRDLVIIAQRKELEQLRGRPAGDGLADLVKGVARLTAVEREHDAG